MNAPLGRLLSLCDRVLTRDRVVFFTSAVLVMAVLLLIVAFSTANNWRTIYGQQLGHDFGQFYVAGTILKTQPERLYDLELGARLYHEIFPTAPAGTSLPYPCAPHLATLMRPLAYLPFPLAYGVWLLVTMALYLAGVVLLWRVCQGRLGNQFPVAGLVAVSFVPFVMETWIGGQSSGVSFFCFALATWLACREHPVAAGIALSFCIFKPTLLSLMLPMLVLSRRARMLGGVLIGLTLWSAISWAQVGGEGMQGWLDLLRTYADLRKANPEVFRETKYTDLVAVTRLLIPNPPDWLWLVPSAVAALVVLLLIPVAWRSRPGWSVSFELAWALGLAWTPLLNPYFGIYDTVMVVVPAFLAADALRRLELTGPELTPGFRVMIAALFFAPWISQFTALLLGLQLYSFAIAALAVYLLRLAYRGVRGEG